MGPRDAERAVVGSGAGPAAFRRAAACDNPGAPWARRLCLHAALLAGSLPSCGLDDRQLSVALPLEAEPSADQRSLQGSVDAAGGVTPDETPTVFAPDPGAGLDAGAAASPCGAGRHQCDLGCVSNTDVATCGTSCEPCPVPEGATAATCDGVRCGIECPLEDFARDGACRLDAVELGVGLNHACALLRDSTLRCWGLNDAGQLGDGSVSNVVNPLPVAVAGLTGARAVRAGASHTCALMDDRSVQCWGDNQRGQLGIGSRSAGSLTAVPVSGLTGALALSAGRNHTCALVSDDTIRCWGSNDEGELGVAEPDGTAPVVVPLSGTPLRVAASGAGGCALLSQGSVECWGFAPAAGAGSPADAGAFAPRDMGLAGVQLIAAGDAHVCVGMGGGNVQCFGSNDAGQLGDGTTSAGSSTPRSVLGLEAQVVTALALGSRHSCLRLQSGDVRCWGDDSLGQLGDGGGPSSSTPVPVPLPSGVLSLAAGASQSCAIVVDGSVWCWGAPSPVPVQVPGW